MKEECGMNGLGYVPSGALACLLYTSDAADE